MSFTRIIGPSWILTPLPLNSWPIATPRWFINVRLKLKGFISVNTSFYILNVRSSGIDTAEETTASVILYIRRSENDTDAGKAEFKSTFRTPRALSSKHKPGKLIFGIAGIFPVQLPDEWVGCFDKWKLSDDAHQWRSPRLSQDWPSPPGSSLLQRLWPDILFVMNFGVTMRMICFDPLSYTLLPIRENWLGEPIFIKRVNIFQQQKFN